MPLTASQLVNHARDRIVEIAPHAFVAENSGVVLIDVREPAEFATGHLPGAINIPRGVLEFQVESHPALAGPPRPVVLYCRSGGRAALAALSLSMLGFDEVRSLSGGIMGWTEADLPIVMPG